MVRTLLVLLLLLVSLPAAQARTEIGRGKIIPAAAVCTAADYASLPSGEDDGTICEALDTGLAWMYDTATGVWLPPGINPSALLADYEGTVLPTAATPAWTKLGTSSCAVAAGVLTCTDTDNDRAFFGITDAANIVSTKSSAIIVRMKVTAIDAGAGNEYRASLELGAAAAAGKGNARFALAYGATLGAAGAYLPVAASLADSTIYDAGMPTNNGWQTYYLIYDATRHGYRFGVLGYGDIWRLAYGHTNASWVTNGSYGFGDSSEAGTCTYEVDWAKAFNF
jgi:hypothetical protein